ncbi:MAG TPA: energy transducer TonB [Candidatus Elarobacter sp.]|jgi:protein TonB
MNRPLLLLAGLAATCAPLVLPAPVRANVFCPVTVAALADVSQPNRPNTYGILLDVERGDTRSARIRLDTDVARYALDVDDIPLMTFGGTRIPKYVTLPPGEHLAAAWVQATGLAANQRLDCPLTAVWWPNAPPPVTPAAQQAADLDRRTLVAAAVRTTLSQPSRFGAISQQACTQPNAPARPLAAIRPPFPPEARSVNATGVVELALDVDETGTVAGAAISRSSGFAPLDRAALETAKRAKFAPATYACHPVATTVSVTTGFGA